MKKYNFETLRLNRAIADTCDELNKMGCNFTVAFDDRFISVIGTAKDIEISFIKSVITENDFGNLWGFNQFLRSIPISCFVESNRGFEKLSAIGGV
jgi:hypothetical protein